MIPEGFDLNSFENLLPTSRHRNQQKGDIRASRTRLAFFLELAREKTPIARQMYEEWSQQRTSLNAYLTLKAEAERFELDFDELLDLKRLEAEGAARARIPLEIDGADDLSLVDAALANHLMHRSFRLGGGGITEVELRDAKDSAIRVTCRNCSEFLEAIDREAWPYTQFDMNCYAMAIRTCETLRYIQKARFAPTSAFRRPRVDLRTLDRWSTKWLLGTDLSGERRADPIFAEGQTLQNAVSSGYCSVRQISPYSVELMPPSGEGIGIQLSELIRADLDQDNEEEILVFSLAFATHGTFRAGHVSVAKVNAATGLL